MDYLSALPSELRTLLSYYVNNDNKRLFLKLYEHYEDHYGSKSSLYDYKELLREYKLKTRIETIYVGKWSQDYEHKLVIDNNDVFTDEFIKKFISEYCTEIYEHARDFSLTIELVNSIADLNILLKENASRYRIVIYDLYCSHGGYSIVKIE